MAVPSRPIDWAARHLEHHAHADREGDPHSPLDGFLHAHVGWIFAVQPAPRERYCRRLLEDRLVVAVDRTAELWFLSGLIVPVLIDGWRGLIWGGLVRIAVHNQTMFAVNSVCHSLGSRDFETKDSSRNNLLVSLLSFGEGWHNNHHAFPSMAVHGIGPGQPDPTGLLIRLLDRVGLIWDVKRPPAELVARRRSTWRTRLVVSADSARCRLTARALEDEADASCDPKDSLWIRSELSPTASRSKRAPSRSTM